MNEQKIEGVPDGWRLVRIGIPKAGEWFMDSSTGDPRIATCDWLGSIRVIIEKIEQPKRHRPFANAAEAEPFFDRRLRYKSCPHAIMRISVLGRTGIEISSDKHTYEQAFDRFECIDGTPFGVEVKE